MKISTKIIAAVSMILFPLCLTAWQHFISNDEIKKLENSGHLIKIGNSQWKTRGGLILKGKDPDGLTRLEHIMRHSLDMGERKIHGVFTINKSEIIELLDLVWNKVKRGSLKGNSRGGNIAYTYTSEKEIGYMGGRDGKEKNHPKIKSVRLVIRENTHQVITFFPME